MRDIREERPGGASYELRVVSDPEELAERAVEELVEAAAEAIAARGRFTLALSGGSTPRRMLERLALDPKRVDWSHVEIFFGDERAVTPQHPDSNYGMAARALLDAIPIPLDQIHRMRGEAPDLHGAALHYEGELARVFGAVPGGIPPALDLVLLGIGADGHTASLFPGTVGVLERRRWVVANPVPQLDCARLTLTFPMLCSARRVVFLVAGAEKADTLAQVLEGPSRPQQLPSQAVAPRTGGLLWLVDEAAASGLSRDSG